MNCACQEKSWEKLTYEPCGFHAQKEREEVARIESVIKDRVNTLISYIQDQRDYGSGNINALYQIESQVRRLFT